MFKENTTGTKPKDRVKRTISLQCSGEDEHATITILLSHKKIYPHKNCVVISMTVIGGAIPETDSVVGQKGKQT